MDVIVEITGVVLRNDQGKFLLVQEGKPAAYGLWNLPAGHVNQGETLQEAAIREAREETGYSVELVAQEPVFDLRHPTKQMHFRMYHAMIMGGELSVDGKEIFDAKWFSVDEIRALEAAGQTRSAWILQAIATVQSNIIRSEQSNANTRD